MTKRNAVPEHVDYDTARKRIIEWWYDCEFTRPIPLHWFADAVWPGHRMRAQGAAFAVSRIVARMKEAKEISLDFHDSGPGIHYWVEAPPLKEK